MPDCQGRVTLQPATNPTGEAFRIADLACEFRLVHEPANGLNGPRLRLEWIEDRPDCAVKIVHGSIAVFFAHSSGAPLEPVDWRNLSPDSFFPPMSSGALYLKAAPYSYASSIADGNTHHVYSVGVGYQTPDDGLFSWERRAASSEERVAAVAHSLVHQQSPHDVCLDFVQLGRQLWTTEASLVAASPYFEDLLSSAYSEGLLAVRELSIEPVEEVSYEFDESDAETDAADLVKRNGKVAVKPLAPFKRIPVTETSYTTWLAVLVWTQTRHIAFAPLVSSFRAANEDISVARSGRADSFKSLVDAQDPRLPAPASPKSVYRLADLLSLDELKALALANLISQLTPLNAAYELYSDIGTCYPPVRDAVLTFVVDNWREVKAAPATQAMEERGVAGELPLGTAGTSMMLLRRLAERLGG